MNYKEIIENKISGGADELNRRREFWERIVTAFKQGGEDEIKSVLLKDSDRITEEFDKLLKQLNEKI